MNRGAQRRRLAKKFRQQQRPSLSREQRLEIIPEGIRARIDQEIARMNRDWPFLLEASSRVEDELRDRADA